MVLLLLLITSYTKVSFIPSLLCLILCLWQLRDGSSHEGTVTSMEPNEGTFVLHSETTKVLYFNSLCPDGNNSKCLLYIMIYLIMLSLLYMREEVSQFFQLPCEHKIDYSVSLLFVSFLFISWSLGHTHQTETFLTLCLTEGQNKTCPSGWCSWAFSSSTQTGWVLASSSRNSFCGGCFGILTKLPCCFRVILFIYSLFFPKLHW